MNWKIKRYESLIRNMNLPQNRKNYSEPNVLWFIRSGAMQNMQHENFYAAYELAKDIIAEA